MTQVQYSRIHPVSTLFIRDSGPVTSYTLIVLSLLVSIVKVVHTQELVSPVSLQTCCSSQAQYDENEGKCLDVGYKDGELTKVINKAFPETLRLPDHLIAWAYRNVTTERTFRLKHQTISCPNGTTSINVSLTTPDLPLWRQRMRHTGFAPDTGYLRHDFHIFYPDEYCFNKISENTLEIMICQPECSEAKPCIPKCCDVGQTWNLTLYPEGAARCVFSGKTQWSPQVYANVKDRKPLPSVRPHLIVSHPHYWCDDVEFSSFHFLQPFRSETKSPFRILQTGEVWYKFDRLTWAPFSKGLHCVDGSFDESGSHSNEVGHYNGDYKWTVTLECEPELIETKHNATSHLYGISMIIAAFFLLITIIVYILLWDKQNVHGWTLLCYFASLFFMYIFYSAVHFTSLYFTQDDGNGVICYLIGVGAHFFFLSSFCFMTAVNFDLWWTFRALMPTGGKSKGIKKFLAYNVFALGIPMIIVTVGLVLDHLYRDDPDSYIIVPEYGRRTCYVDRVYAIIPYLYGPAGFMLTCNVMFFTVTVYTMVKIQQSTKFATMSSSKNAKQRQSMVLFAKLFLIMGLPWIFEVISSTTQRTTSVPIFFQITDMINIFQAVAIFIIFVLKVDIRNSLENRYPLFRRFILAITIRPEQADSIIRRHPRLRFIINPLTRSITSNRSFSTAKTTLSNGTEGSTSSRANVLGRGSETFDRPSSLTGSSSARSSPTESLGKRGGEKHDPEEILELR